MSAWYSCNTLWCDRHVPTKASRVEVFADDVRETWHRCTRCSVPLIDCARESPETE